MTWTELYLVFWQLTNDSTVFSTKNTIYSEHIQGLHPNSGTVRKLLKATKSTDMSHRYASKMVLTVRQENMLNNWAWHIGRQVDHDYTHFSRKSSKILFVLYVIVWKDKPSNSVCLYNSCHISTEKGKATQAKGLDFKISRELEVTEL